MKNLPNQILSIIKDFAIFKPKNTEEIRVAVDIWYYDKKNALKYYGHISIWDVSLIRNFSRLFMNKRFFNDNISNWKISKKSNIKYMFIGTWSLSYINLPNLKY